MKARRTRSGWFFLLCLGCVTVAFGTTVYLQYRSARLDALLIDAVTRNDAHSVREQLLLGANPNTRGHSAAMHGNVLNFIKQLFSRDETSDFGPTPLTLAALSGSVDVSKILLDHGADPNQAPRDGVLPLMCAEAGGNKEITILLLARGAAINAKGYKGLTALMVAADYGRDDINLLLKHGADVSVKDEMGLTALGHAQNSNWLWAASVLEKAGTKK
jgi:ankyrin repeat protein